MPDLIEVRVARDEEHVTGDALCQHLLASDIVGAERQKDPRHVRLNDHVALRVSSGRLGLVLLTLRESVEQVEHASLDENAD